MREVILIAGLPGSGKTVLGQKLAKEKGYVLLDDASHNVPLNGMKEKLKAYADAQGLVLADPMLCVKGAIKGARALLATCFGQVPVHVIAFENDPKQCLANVAARDDGRLVHQFIHTLAKQWDPYAIADCQVISVYSPCCKA